MRTPVVLVHGAWQGPWCWDRLRPLLAERGIETTTPTLTGSGERASELTCEVDLSTHVADITAHIDRLESPVVLVAHSYAGMAVPGVVHALPDRVRSVVFVDSFYPQGTESAMDLLPGPLARGFRDTARRDGDGWRLPATDAMLDIWGLDEPADRTWVRERLTDWSLVCFESVSDVSDTVLEGTPQWYVEGSAPCPARAAFAPMARRAAINGATTVEVASGHDVMIEAPMALAATVIDASVP